MEMAESQGAHIALFSITEKTCGEGEGTGPECAHRSLQIGAHTLLTDMSPIFGAPGTSSASAGEIGDALLSPGTEMGAGRQDRSGWANLISAQRRGVGG